MTKVQQASHIARATVREDGGLDVAIIGTGGVVATRAEPLIVGGSPVPAALAFDNAIARAGFYMLDGDTRECEDGSMECHVAPLPADPSVPAWADESRRYSWDYRLDGGLSRFFEKSMPGGVTLSQEVIVDRDGRILWGEIEILGPEKQDFTSPAEARAVAVALIAAADEAERIMAGAR